MVVSALGLMGVMTARQVQILAYSLNNDWPVHRALLDLVERRQIARLKRRSPTEPYIYYPKGLRPKLIGHNLGVSEMFVRIVRATSEYGWKLNYWLTPKDLQPLLKQRSALAPDAYFEILKDVKTSVFFLEYEHTDHDLTSKFVRYADIYKSGYYTQTFGRISMRVLVVLNNPKQLKHGLNQAENVGFAEARFITMEQVQAITSNELVTTPVWWKAGTSNPIALWEGLP